jgi:predicted transcriptional regulator
MSKTHDKPALSSGQKAARRKIVERARKARPGPDELIDRGEIDELLSQGQFIEVRTLCTQLRKLRERAGLSLTDFSEQSGLTRAMISRLENGWNLNPTVETLFRYSEALGAGLKLVLDESGRRRKVE